jgi:hypothetical protein
VASWAIADSSFIASFPMLLRFGLHRSGVGATEEPQPRSLKQSAVRRRADSSAARNGPRDWECRVREFLTLSTYRIMVRIISPHDAAPYFRDWSTTPRTRRS